MTTPASRSAKDLFLDAIELDEDARRERLAELERADPELAARVRRLVEAHEREHGRVVRGLASIQRVLARDVGARVESGTRLGDYELLEEVGSGASGAVFRARQLSLDRIVAVKVLRAGQLAGEKEVARFRAEAEAVARLDDAHIVSVYEVGESEAGPFFSMKWVGGGSLADACGRFARDPAAAARSMARVAGAVHHAHQRGILHRDLKPSNILLGEDGAPYVADFGIAKRIDEGEASAGTVWIAGTPAYMAPEQVSPELGELSVATDVWGLGAILHEMLSGRPPFEGESLTEVLAKVRTRPPAPLPPSVPADLATIVGKCLEKDPELRYPSANALRVDLERWLHLEPILARPTTNAERFFLWTRRQPLVAALLLAVTMLAITLAGGGTWASLRLKKQVRRIESAEREATERLRNSLLAQARYLRLGSEPDRRTVGLDLIRQAWAIRPGGDLRDEAIACLALPEATVERRWPVAFEREGVIDCDDAFQHFAVTERDGGGVGVHRVADGELVARLPPVVGQTWYARFSPDGSLLGAKYHEPGFRNPAFVLWDWRRGREVARLPLLADWMAFHPDGATLLVATDDGNLLEVDTASGEVRRSVALGGSLFRAELSSAGDRLAVVRYPERTIAVLSWPALEPVWELEEEATVFGLDWSPDDARLAFGSADRAVHVVDAGTGEPLRTFEGHGADVVRVAFAPDRAWLASGSWDGTTRVWDLANGDPLLVLDFDLVRVGRGGRVAFTAGDRAGVARIDAETIRHAMHGHDGKNPQALSFSPDGRVLASTGATEVLFWDPFTGERLAELAEPRLRSAFFLGADRVVTASYDRLAAWAIPRDPVRLRVHDHEPESVWLDHGMESACATPDGSLVAALCVGGKLHLLAPGDEGVPDVLRRIDAFPDAIRPSLDPEGRWVACGNWKSRAEKVCVWDVATGERVAELLADGASFGVGFDPLGRFLVAGSGHRYHVFRVGDWREVRTIERPTRVTQSPLTLAFRFDGIALLRHSEAAVELRDLASGEPLARFESPFPAPLGPLALSARHLAVGSSLNRIEVWELERIQARLTEVGIDLAALRAASPPTFLAR